MLSTNLEIVFRVCVVHDVSYVRSCAREICFWCRGVLSICVLVVSSNIVVQYYGEGYFSFSFIFFALPCAFQAQAGQQGRMCAELPG